MATLLDPTILMAIRDLSLSAKLTVDGFMTGLHQSRVKGPGLEFSQYRSYQPGDDLRWLDWKMYARSDRYYIRESEIETSISVRFLVDGSRSMSHLDGAFSKIQYARYLAASLGYLAYLQGDAIGLSVIREGAVTQLPSRRDPAQLSRFLYQLEEIRPEGRFMKAAGYQTLFGQEATPKKSLFIFISDLYEYQGEIVRLLETLAALGHEVITLHLLGENEVTMDFGRFSTLEDLETGDTISFHPGDQAASYHKHLQTYLASLKSRLQEKRITYRLMTMNTPLNNALREFLQMRQHVNR